MLRNWAILFFTSITMCLFFRCAKQETTVIKATTETTTYTVEDDSTLSLLKNIEITLPDYIIIKYISNTSAYFYKGNEVVGGIALLNIADQMDTMDMQAYANQALSVVKTVYNTAYDYMAASDPSCHAIVSTASHDGKEFYHYFFKGNLMGYDIWMNHSVMDTRDMRSCLRTLHSDDINNPQDYITINEDVPLLNLRVTIPDEITRTPVMTTRELFYRDETLVGGIEQFLLSTDLHDYSLLVQDFVSEMYHQEFHYSITQNTNGENVIAIIYADSESTSTVHHIINVESECYDVWVDTAYLSEEEAFSIAQSCQY